LGYFLKKKSQLASIATPCNPLFYITFLKTTGAKSPILGLIKKRPARKKRKRKKINGNGIHIGDKKR
jgi:hypothetical protein